jgi:hypothetical protein
MTWYEFTFDARHPQDKRICLRFVVQVPIPAAVDLPQGSVLETLIQWREDRHD